MEFVLYIKGDCHTKWFKPWDTKNSLEAIIRDCEIALNNRFIDKIKVDVLKNNKIIKTFKTDNVESLNKWRIKQ